MAKKPTKTDGPGKPGPDYPNWVAANAHPDPREVQAREDEEAIQDFLDDAIEARREAIEAGDGEALLDALFDSCMSDRSMPLWLRDRVANAVRRYTKLHTRTLDEAFRLPERKQFKAQSKRARLAFRIYCDVCQLHHAGAVINQELYHAVGKRHGVGRNLVAECYTKELARRGGRRIGRPILPESLPVSLHEAYEAVTGKRMKKRL